MHGFYSSHQLHHDHTNSASSLGHTASHLHPFHNPNTGFYHPHHMSSLANQEPTNNGYSSPPAETQNSLQGNESPTSVVDFPTNNIQLPETPNSMVTIMGPTSGNSNSNDAANSSAEVNVSENVNVNTPSPANNNNNNNNHSENDSYNPWHMTSTHNLSNGPVPAYNASAASLYNAHHNFTPSLMQQNIGNFAHPHANKGFGMTQSFGYWY